MRVSAVSSRNVQVRQDSHSLAVSRDRLKGYPRLSSALLRMVPRRRERGNITLALECYHRGAINPRSAEEDVPWESSGKWRVLGRCHRAR